MKGQSAIEYLMTYGWMLLVVAIVAGAIYASVTDSAIDDPSFNKSNVMEVVERGAGQDCEWDTVEADTGRIDCTQQFTWKNQSYTVHDYFQIKHSNGTVEITQ